MRNFALIFLSFCKIFNSFALLKFAEQIIFIPSWWRSVCLFSQAAGAPSIVGIFGSSQKGKLRWIESYTGAASSIR